MAANLSASSFAGNAAASASPAGVAIAGGTVACVLNTNPTIQLWTSPVAGPYQSSPTTTLSGSDSGSPAGLVLSPSGNAAYFNNQLSGNTSTVNLYACSLGGVNSCRSFISYPSTVPGKLAISGGNFIYMGAAGNGVVGRVDIANNSSLVVATGQGNVLALATDSASVYWTGQGSNQTFSIGSASLTAVPPMPKTILGGASGITTSIATDGKNVYFGLNAGSGKTSYVAYVPVAGSTAPTTLASTATASIIYDVAIAGGAIYWVTAGYSGGGGMVYGLRLP
jgi:hypothetical protein